MADDAPPRTAQVANRLEYRASERGKVVGSAERNVIAEGWRTRGRPQSGGPGVTCRSLEQYIAGRNTRHDASPRCYIVSHRHIVFSFFFFYLFSSIREKRALLFQITNNVVWIAGSAKQRTDTRNVIRAIS